MLRTRAPEASLWEAVLPEEVLRLSEELARVDALLDDPAFFAPFVPFFDPRVGRPSTPMEVYLRLMFLKFRYRLGYESLCREVSDSITWRRFCRIPAGWSCSASDDVDEAAHAVRCCGGRRVQRGVVGQGGRGDTVASPR
jgi:IS5 family transposase